MNKWRKQYEEHILHKELDEVNKLIDTSSLKTTDSTILEAFSRLVIVIKHCDIFVSALNPECTAKTLLDALASSLTQIKTYLAAFLKTENVVQIQSANSHADILLQHMTPYELPSAASQQAAAINKLIVVSESLIGSLTDQSKLASESLAKVQAQSNTIAQQLKQFEQTIESQKGRLDKAIEAFQKQFSESEATRRKEIQATENNFRALSGI
jgi:gas vesicle protein